MNFITKLFSTARADAKIFHPTHVCPECGSKLMQASRRDELCESHIKSSYELQDGGSYNSPLRAGEDWQCPNPDCPAQVRRWLAHWCAPEVMDVPGADARFISLLAERGLARDVAELYRIKVKELAALPGMDKDSAQKFFDMLTASLKREAWRLLVGLNVPLVGAAEAQALMRGFPTVDAVFAAGVPRLMRDAGVSEEAAHSLVRWQSDPINRKLLRRLEKAGANFKSGSFEAA